MEKSECIKKCISQGENIEYTAGQPHYIAIFEVHRSRPCYKGNCVIMRLLTTGIQQNNQFGSHDMTVFGNHIIVRHIIMRLYCIIMEDYQFPFIIICFIK